MISNIQEHKYQKNATYSIESTINVKEILIDTTKMETGHVVYTLGRCM
jgi:hypothetical protein